MQRTFFQFCCCLALTCLGLPGRAAGADVTATIYACVPSWGQLGSITFVIDTSYKRGPFLVRLTGPNGRVDSLVDFTGLTHTFDKLQAGRYFLEVKCCATCSADLDLEVKSYEEISAGTLSLLYTLETSLPEMDSTALLVACTAIIKSEGIPVTLNFSLYNAGNLPPAVIQNILNKAALAISKDKLDVFEDNSALDAWLSEEFEVLLRFEPNGALRWVYFP